MGMRAVVSLGGCGGVGVHVRSQRTAEKMGATLKVTMLFAVNNTNPYFPFADSMLYIVSPAVLQLRNRKIDLFVRSFVCSFVRSFVRLFSQ